MQFDVHDASPYCQRYAEHCYKPHRHSFFQLIWFKKSGTHFVDYDSFDHPPNSVFFLTERQVHCFCEKSANEGLLFHFNDVFLNRAAQDAANQMQYHLFNEIGQPFIELTAESREDLDYISGKLRKEILEKPYNYRQQVYHLFQSLLLSIERLKRSEEEAVVFDQHLDLALRFKKAIEQEKEAFHSVAYFSQILGVSEKTLSKVSKKYFHLTPARLIHQKKILEAKRLLSNTQLTIKEIAYQLGFEQATYFTKYFKKHTEVTPKVFQKQFR